MSAVVYLCLLIAVVTSCPFKKDCQQDCKIDCQPDCSILHDCNKPNVDNKCDLSPDFPSICPSNWKVATFDDQYGTIIIQGIWYVQLATPTCLDTSNPIRSGIFSISYPSSYNRLIFKDTTDCPFDYNTDYVVLDSSYNMVTQNLETTQCTWRAAFGAQSNYAIFNVRTEQYYPNSINEITPLEDASLNQYELDNDSLYKRQYVVAVITDKSNWDDYMVLVVLNEYKNIFNENEHLIWVLSRQSVPDDSLYSKAMNDILNSGLNPYNLMSINQIPDLTVLPNISIDDIDGVVKSTTVTTSSMTKSFSTSNDECSVSSTSSSYSSTTTETSSSSVVFTLNSDYKISYDYDSYDLCNGIKILKNVDSDTIREMLCGTYYTNIASPSRFLDDETDIRVGMLRTSYPASGLVVNFDVDLDIPWTDSRPIMMVDRGYNRITGQYQQTRNLLAMTQNEFGSFVMYSEGYYKTQIEEYSPLSWDNIPNYDYGKLYSNKYLVFIAGYEKDKFLILCYANKFKNLLFDNEKNSMNHVVVLTRDRSPSNEVVEIISQELTRCGINSQYLMNIDQSTQIDKDFVFDQSYFEYSFESSNSLTTSECKSSVIQSSTSQSSVVVSRDLSSTLNEENTPCITLPSICPPNFNISPFDDNSGNPFYGQWYCQAAPPTYMSNLTPMKTGIFSNTFPSSCNKISFPDNLENSPFDYDKEYLMIDSSFNTYTGHLDNVRSLIKSAYGRDSKYALFSVYTEQYYSEKINEKNPLIDASLLRRALDDQYTQEYTFAVITKSDCWNDYMVVVLLNDYDNFYIGNENHLIWIFSRQSNPDNSIYTRAMDDIINSGLNPEYLMSINQIPDFTDLPYMTTEEIEDIDKTVSVSTSSSSSTRSISTNNNEFSSSIINKSSSYSSTTETSSSSVVFTLNQDYTIDYEYGPYDSLNGINILKNIKNELIREMLSGNYFVTLATPSLLCDDNEDTNVGLLKNSFPASGIEVRFDGNNNVLNDETPIMMVDRGYNRIKDIKQETRNLVTLVYSGDDNPWASFMIYSESNYKNKLNEYSTSYLDGLNIKNFGDLYRDTYLMSIAGYEKDKYLILCFGNTFKNNFYSYDDNPLNQVVILTRDRFPSTDVTYTLTQEISRCGINPRHLMAIDQSTIVEEDFIFEESYFEYSSESSYSITSESSVATESSSSITSSTSKSFSACTKIATDNVDVEIC